MLNVIEGNLIDLALKGEFDVIVHGCNCFSTMGAGIALGMAKTFGCDNFLYEQDIYTGDINKLGIIDYQKLNKFFVVNAYTQFQPGKNLDYAALRLCLKKINFLFTGLRVGLPQIGCGIAGGKWNKVFRIIKQELKNCNVTIVIYNK